MRRELAVGITCVLLLHHISNTNSCLEGIAPDNEYRIVGTDIENVAFARAAVKGFRFLKRFGMFEVYERD